MGKKKKHGLAAMLLMVVCGMLLLNGCGSAVTDELAMQSTEEQRKNREATEKMAPQMTEMAETELPPDSFPMEFVFSSGAGGWGTFIRLEKDGSFQGSFSDSEMGEQGEGYPNGTIYFCDFTGQFRDIEQIDSCTYSMTLYELKIQSSDEQIEDGIRYVSAEPYGFESGKEFLLYTPETSLEGLTEEFLSWWPDNWRKEEDSLKTLDCYGLYNQENGYGFFSME